MTTVIDHPLLDDAAEDSSGSDYEVVRDSLIAKTKEGDLVVFDKETDYSTEESEVDDDEDEEIEMEEIVRVDKAPEEDKTSAVGGNEKEQVTNPQHSNNDGNLSTEEEKSKIIEETERRKVFLYWARMFIYGIMVCSVVTSAMCIVLMYQSYHAQIHINELNQKIKAQQEIIDQAASVKEPAKIRTVTPVKHVDVIAGLFLTATMIMLIHYGSRGITKQEQQVMELKNRLSDINNKVQQYKERERKRKALKYQNRRKNVAKDVA